MVLLYDVVEWNQVGRVEDEVRATTIGQELPIVSLLVQHFCMVHRRRGRLHLLQLLHVEVVAQVARRLVLRRRLVVPRGARWLLAGGDEQLLPVEVETLIRHEIAHGFVEGLVGPVRGAGHRPVLLEAQLVVLCHVVRVDFLGEADVVAHGGLGVLLLLMAVELVLAFG